MATGLVAGYHFAVWRRDRSTAPPKPERPIGRIILVTSAESGPVPQAITHVTGAPVTVWRRSGPASAAEPTADELSAALAGIQASRVLVITGTNGQVEVISLQD